MSTYYVRTDGSDSNTGASDSAGAAFLTLDKCFQTASLGGIHTFNLKAGTYQENTAAAGYLALNRTFTGSVTIQPTDVGGAVIVQGTSDARYNIRPTAAPTSGAGVINWSNIIFTARAGSTEAFTLETAFSTAMTWTSCTFNADNANATYGFRCTIGTNTTVTHTLTWTQCTFTHPNAGSGDAWTHTTSGTSLCTANIILDRCTGTSAGEGGHVDGFKTYCQVLGNTWTVSATNVPAFILGNDTPTSGCKLGWSATGSIVKGSTFTNSVGHAFEVGDLVRGSVVTGNTFNAGNYAGVWKTTDTGNICQGNFFNGGSLASLFVKGCANGGSFTGNVFKNSAAYLVINIDVSNFNNTGNVIKGNRFIMTGTASAFNWSSTLDVGGTTVIDYNIYDNRGSGNFGTVYATAGVTTLAGLAAAWSGYATAGNETHSQLAATQYIMQTKYTSTGSWLYAQIQNAQGQLWNGSAFETPVAANYHLYNLLLVEDPTGGYYYNNAFPLMIGSGRYIAAYYLRSGSYSVPTDAQIGSNLDVLWNGTTVIFQTGDSFARLGAPVGASHSADVAAVKSVLGTPSGASVSADILSNYTRLGAPAGATHAADVAAVKSDSATIKAKTDNFLFDGSSFVKANIQATAATLVFNQTGNVSGSVGSVAGSVTGAVGSITGVTFPSNFAVLAIEAVTGKLALTAAEHTLISNDLLNAVVFGTVTVKQVLGTSFGVLANDITRTWVAATHTSTVVAYACQTGSTAADHTKPMVTQVTVYDATNTQIVSRSTTFSNLP